MVEQTAPSARPTLSVLIKALNEERRIAACLDAVIAGTQGLDAEIILVDSVSTDRTVEIARRYPIRIVQFDRPEDRGCGAAVQLGYQVARGEFLYVLDADMQLAPDFLPLALAVLAEDSGLAGVGGRLIDEAVRTEADVRRAHLAAAQVDDLDVPELGGGGLYRRSAIEQVGYLANRWLSAYEEADLGARLRAAGWRLKRLHAVAVHHQGHAETNGAMLLRLWRNGRAKAAGAFLRSAWGQPWWRHAVKKQRHLFVNASLWLVSAAMAGLMAWAGYGMWIALSCLLGGPVLLGMALSLKKRSFVGGLWAWLSWQMSTVAAILGWMQRPRDPFQAIAARSLATSISETE